MNSGRTFLPAAGHDLFLPLYDPFTRLIGADRARRALLAQADLRPGHRVLDVGCGTGSLAVLIKRRHPGVDVVGLDPDERALARARRKAERAAVAVAFDRGFSDALGYPDAGFDRVFSSLMFHHLDRDDRERSLREIRRVLKPDGRLELVDFAGPRSGGGGLMRWLHSHHRLEANDEEAVVGLMTRAGFARAEVVGRGRLLLGRLVYYQAA